MRSAIQVSGMTAERKESSTHSLNTSVGTPPCLTPLIDSRSRRELTPFFEDFRGEAAMQHTRRRKEHHRACTHKGHHLSANKHKATETWRAWMLMMQHSDVAKATHNARSLCCESTEYCHFTQPYQWIPRMYWYCNSTEESNAKTLRKHQTLQCNDAAIAPSHAHQDNAKRKRCSVMTQRKHRACSAIKEERMSSSLVVKCKTVGAFPPMKRFGVKEERRGPSVMKRMTEAGVGGAASITIGPRTSHR